MLEMMMVITLLISQFCQATTFKLNEVENVKLKIKVAQLVARDQTVRKELNKYIKNGQFAPSMVNFLNKIDLENLGELKKLLKHYVLLPSSDKHFLNNVWLLSQHADHDLNFQKKMLDQFKLIAAIKPTELKHYAYLFDRVQINQHLRQRYGTQGHCVGKHHWMAFEIENTKALDAVRISAGIDRFGLYQATMNNFCF